MDWEVDRSLRIRMVATLGLILVMPLVFTYTLAGALNRIVLPIAAEGEATTTISFDPIVVLALTVVGIGLAYFRGGAMALSSTGARTVSEKQRPDLHNRVGRLANTVGLSKPQVAVVNSEVPNAFATGGRGTDETVAVTTGLLDRLDGDQLDAVLAHELAHIRNRDATVMSVAYLLPTLTYIVSKVTFTFLRVFLQGLGSGSSRNDRDAGKVILVVIAAAVVTLTVSAIFWLASNVLFRLLSQYREYAADRGSAAITGNPLALASALETIDDEMRALPDRDLRELDGGVEALYISSINVPMFNDDDDGLVGELLSQELFPASHPPTTERIERLKNLAGDLES